ncbi:B-cell receptor CD22-like [Myxocyprinus asiaticus]|uniref:B-cell receptor CD22-like n=1 Tax=Myxocyprinus asiaticus TaxID=70543 RepID=UPI00222344A6|nr:B-cell receptor CD22-like [Myxocyprinus asiaticus]
MVMSVRMALLPLIFLLIIEGVYSTYWDVSYSSSYICAIKGSSVIMPCTYTYPTGYQITNVFWTDNTGSDPPNLLNYPEYSQRIQYLGDYQQNCTLRLIDVTQNDARKYYFRFITDQHGGKWTGKSGVTLDVTDLHVESPESVTEGDTVSLTCKSTCNVNNRATFIWLKNTQSLTETSNTLILQSVRREDAGRYSCAVHGYNLTSPHTYLNVKYAPKNVSVSISGSGEIVLGDSVNLTCSCDSNPPVLNYTWFKENTTVGSEEIYSITWIRSDHSGEYKCKSKNEVGEKYSDAVTLNVLYPPKNVSVSISGSGEIVEGDSVNLTCSCDSNPPVVNYTWFKDEKMVEAGEIYSITRIRPDHSGEYKCKSRNEVGEKYSDVVTLNVLYPPSDVSVSISGSGEIVLGDSVTLTCSCDSNPPVLNYTWFKGNETSAVGSGQSYSALQIGFFYCVAQNQHGSQRSAAVQLTVKGENTVLYAVAGVTGGCGVLIFILILFICLYSKKKKHRPDDIKQKQNDPYASVTRMVQTPHVHVSKSADCDDAQYANVSHKWSDQTADKASESRDIEEIQYATVQHHKYKEMKRPEEDESQYDIIRIHQPDAAVARSADQIVEDQSVIYSTVK